MEQTTRERIAAHLQEQTATPSALAVEFDITPYSAVTHVRHLARSVDSQGHELQVAPPECKDCGFSRFDDPANLPSRCPDCKSESLTEPVFRIQ